MKTVREIESDRDRQTVENGCGISRGKRVLCYSRRCNVDKTCFCSRTVFLSFPTFTFYVQIFCAPKYLPTSGNIFLDFSRESTKHFGKILTKHSVKFINEGLNSQAIAVRQEHLQNQRTDPSSNFKIQSNSTSEPKQSSAIN